MNSELKDWLWWTWENRERIMELAPGPQSAKGNLHFINHKSNRAIKEIYKYYTKVTTERPEPTAALLRQHANGLIEMRQKLGLEHLLTTVDGEKCYVPDHVIRRMSPQDLMRHFIFFKKNHAPATHRMYVNLAPSFRLRGFYNVTKRIWDIDSLTTAKVVGPGAHRADNTVYYFLDEASQLEAVERLRRHSKQYPEEYLAETPKLTKPVKGMPGVALGVQPPKAQLLRVDKYNFGMKEVQGMSFGKYRATLIFMALDRSDFPSYCSPLYYKKWIEFKWRAENYFRKAGINPSKPWGQGETIDTTEAVGRKIDQQIATLNASSFQTAWPHRPQGQHRLRA